MHVKQFVSLLLILNNTTYASNNNSCHCYSLSTTQLMCQTTRVTVVVCQLHNLCVKKQLVPLLLFVKSTTVCVKQQFVNTPLSFFATSLNHARTMYASNNMSQTTVLSNNLCNMFCHFCSMFLKHLFELVTAIFCIFLQRNASNIIKITLQRV